MLVIVRKLIQNLGNSHPIIPDCVICFQEPLILVTYNCASRSEREKHTPAPEERLVKSTHLGRKMTDEQVCETLLSARPFHKRLCSNDSCHKNYATHIL